MTWGGGRGNSSVPLRYAALKAALDTKKTGPKKYRSLLWLYQRYVTAYYVGDEGDIALKLYRTEIVHFHPDGTKTVYGADWVHSNQTRIWLGNAGVNVQSVKPNDWSPKQFVVDGSKFYDGMKLRNGTLISKAKPIIKNVPNAEAKALRKRITKLAQVYRTFAMMHAGSQQKFDSCRLDSADIRAALDDDHHEFDLELYKYLQATYYAWRYRNMHPYKRVQSTLTKFYKQEVARLDLFDVTEVHL